MPQDQIVVRGAREHNLKDVTVAIPRDRLVVITGLSGSGKSSLAFDTIYAEGQRRYVESLSAYARQFLGQMEKPDVDQIDGLSARDLHRPEGRVAQPALHGRHGHRDLRPPAAAVRAHRPSALPQRPRDPAPVRAADRGPDPAAAGGDAAAGPGAADQGPQDRRRPRLRGGPPAGLRARPRGRRAVRPVRGAHARQVQAPHDRGRGGPLHRPPCRGARRDGARRGRPADRSGDRPRHPGPGHVPPGGFRRDRAPDGRGRRRDRAPAPRDGDAAIRGAPLFGALHLPVRRLHDRRAGAAVLLVQLAPRRVSCLHRPRDPPGDRSGPPPAGPVQEHQAGRVRGVVAHADGGFLAVADPRGGRDVARLATGRAGVEAARRGDQALPVRRSASEGRHRLPPRARREHLRRDVRGPRPNLERRYRETDSEFIKSELEKFMVTRPCPACEGTAPQAGGPRRHRRRPQHLGRPRCPSRTRSTWITGLR